MPHQDLLQSIALAVVGVGGTIFGRWWERRAQSSTDQIDAMRSAALDLVTASQMLDLRAHQVIQAAAEFGSLSLTALRVLRAAAPFDPFATRGLLDKTAKELFDAEGRVRLMCDDATIALAEQVMDTAAELVRAHHETLGTSIANAASILLTGRSKVDRERVASIRSELEARQAALIEHVRCPEPQQRRSSLSYFGFLRRSPHR